MFFKKSVKTAVLEDGRRPGALVSTKLSEWYRFGVGHDFFLSFLLWCSLVEPTPVYPGGRRGNNFRPHARIATGSAWQGVARFVATSAWARELLSQAPPGRESWQFLREGEHLCHRDRLSTQGVGSSSEHRRIEFQASLPRRASFRAFSV